MIIFHDSGYHCLKHFYLQHVCRLFPQIVQYNHFVELGHDVAVSSYHIHEEGHLGQVHRDQICRQSPFRVCRDQQLADTHSQDLQGNRAERKMLHGLVLRFQNPSDLHERGELLNFMIMPGEVDDRKPLEYKTFVEALYGKLVGGKGYISRNLFHRLFVDGILLIIKLKNYMKGSLMSVSDKLLLRRGAL